MRLTKNKWFKVYLKTLLPQLYLIVGILAIFGLLTLFNRTPFHFYGYAAQLSLFLWLCMILAQWFIFKRRVNSVQELRSEDKIENPLSIDQAYERQYKHLEDEYQTYKDLTNDKAKEQMDYFTLWLHQIKTPISAISLILENLKDESNEKKQMQKELIQLNDYTHMALNYLKLEDIGKEMDLEEVNLDRVIKETIKKYSIIFIYNDIGLDYEGVQANVLTDRKWLQVLIEQLLSNSLKYTSIGTIRIYLENPERLIIEDTGSGIRKEDLPKIFEKGYTGYDGRLHDKSTGLGLFLSKMICERLGHGLSIDSEVGVGTKAIIDFSRPDLNIFD